MPNTGMNHSSIRRQVSYRIRDSVSNCSDHFWKHGDQRDRFESTSAQDSEIQFIRQMLKVQMENFASQKETYPKKKLSSTREVVDLLGVRFDSVWLHVKSVEAAKNWKRSNHQGSESMMRIEEVEISTRN